MNRGGIAVGLQQTGERDCGRLRTILRGDERAGGKKPRLYCCTVSRQQKSKVLMLMTGFLIMRLICEQQRSG